METSDSTRLSIDRKALQDQLQAATPRTLASRLATVTPQRQKLATETHRVAQHLIAPPSAFTMTGARPKQVQGQIPAPPRIPATEKIHTTTIEKGHSTAASNSSPETPAGSGGNTQNQSADTQTHESTSIDEEEQSMKILNQIAKLKRRARGCMSKEPVSYTHLTLPTKA